jgi:hypothetical protein
LSTDDVQNDVQPFWPFSWHDFQSDIPTDAGLRKPYQEVDFQDEFQLTDA